MAVNGLALGYVAGGFVLFWAGLKNQSPAQTVKDLLSGNLSGLKAEGTLFSTATPSIGVSTDSASSSGNENSGPGTDVTSADTKTNAQNIYNYMKESAGYSAYAAAGIVACCYGESGCNPESVGSGGAGLIAWTPPSSMSHYGGTCKQAGIGNESVSTDFDNQLKAIVGYNNAQGSEYISMLNQQTSIQTAADVYSQYFERPAQLDSDVNATGIALAAEVSGLPNG
jgi:hypothetical protein